MLIGSFAHSVDAKGRIFIPAKWRTDLGERIIVTRGILGTKEQRCLFGMSEEQWNLFAEKFSALPVTDVMGQAFRRMLFSNAAECELDKQGRILIPNGLREYAQLAKDAVLVGVDNRIEIWPEHAWNAHSDGIADDYDEALARLAQMGV